MSISEPEGPVEEVEEIEEVEEVEGGSVVMAVMIVESDLDLETLEEEYTPYMANPKTSNRNAEMTNNAFRLLVELVELVVLVALFILYLRLK